MPLHKQLLKSGFTLPKCEKHFHDHDETWLILKGRGTGYWIDHAGQRQEFTLEEGDVWMVPAGFEHGSNGFPDTGLNSDDFTITVCNGTLPVGSHSPGHYYVDKERYIPTLNLVKNPTDRYAAPAKLPATMPAIWFTAPGVAVLRQDATPGCPPGHILCRSLYTGLTNGTERNVMMGGNYGGTYPSRCAYQNVGRVLEAGAGVRDFAVGDIVFSGDFRGHQMFFAVDVLQPNHLVVKLPPTAVAKECALLGIASVAMHDVRRAEVKLGNNVLIVGAGLVGQFTAQCARAAGAVVTVVDPDAHRTKMAKDLGAHSAICQTSKDEWAVVRHRGPFDAIFEDSGGPVLDALIGANWGQGLIRERGRVVIIAGRDRVDYSFNAAQGTELQINHAGHFVRDDLAQAARLVAEGVLKVGPLIQDVVPYELAVERVYTVLRDAPSKLFGTVFDWGADGRR